MTDKDREEWERALIAFLTEPPAPKRKDARARRVRPSKPKQRCQYT